MKKVSKQLMAFYMAQAALALVFIVLFELDVLPAGIKADDKQYLIILYIYEPDIRLSGHHPPAVPAVCLPEL